MARRKRKRIASRGSVNNIILKTLVNGDKYGYEIIKEVEEFSDGKIILKQPSLYSSLSRFEEKKYVSSYWGDSDIGGRRHYYHLTEEGLSYYKKAVLKETDEEDNAEDYIDELSHESIEQTPTEDEIKEIYEYDNEIEDTESESKAQTRDTSLAPIELDDNEIPAIINFEETKDETDEFVPDHTYFTPTPMEAILNSSTYSNHTQTNGVEDLQGNSDYNKPWQSLSNSAKTSNKTIANSKFKIMYLKKPKKQQKVILDKDGIYKLRDEDYVEQKQRKPIIIDNVIKRSKDSNVYGYGSYTEYNNKPKQTQYKAYSELTEEEKRQRNENFLAKFNLLTNSKMKPVSSPVAQAQEKPRQEEKTIDYRSKLNAIIESTYIEDTPEEVPEKNNLFNYIEEDSWNVTDQNTSENTPVDNQDEDDKFIDFEPVQEFEIKNSNTHYAEEINNFYPNKSEVKINRYEHRSQAVLSDKTFILINKLKFIFGIIMSLFMVSELLISLLVFKNSNLFVDGDSAVFVWSFVAVAIFALIYILPFCFNANHHKANNFKFNISFWFGIITFLVCTILIYCINALSGFELDNFKFFAIKLIVPMILCFNFIIAPVVYQILLKRKIFYD